MTPSKLNHFGTRALQSLGSLGIQCHPENRLVRATRFIGTFSDGPVKFDAMDSFLIRRIAESQQLVVDMYMATRLLAAEPTPEWISKVERSLDGPDVPSESSNTARDTQFELALHSLFIAGGVRVWFAEPDLRIEMLGEVVGVAAKRVWNPEQLKKRLSQAAAQIAESGHRGILAINVDQYLSDAELPAELQEMGDAFNESISRLQGHVDWMLKKPEIRGYLAKGSAFTWHPKPPPPRAAMSDMSQFFLLADSDEEVTRGETWSRELLARAQEWYFQNF